MFKITLLTTTLLASSAFAYSNYGNYETSHAGALVGGSVPSGFDNEFFTSGLSSQGGLSNGGGQSGGISGAAGFSLSGLAQIGQGGQLIGQSGQLIGQSGRSAPVGFLPIERQQNVQFVNVPQQLSAAPIEPAQLLVDSQMNPISLVYRSHGAPIRILQQYVPSQPTFKQTQSQDEPSRHIHTIHKPVIQEVREIITPFRKITQTIQPVQEEVQTVVAKGVPVAQPVAVAPVAVAQPIAAAGPVLIGNGGFSRLGSVRAVGRLVAGPAIGVAAGEYAGLATAGPRSY